MTRLDDVARIAGVSKTTVSRILNNRGYIASGTRERVYSAMQSLSYHPEKIVRGRLSSRASTVGLLVPDICYSYFSEMARAIEDELAKRGYRMILGNIYNLKNSRIDTLEIFQKGPIDGIILCNYPLQESEILNNKLPIVSVDRYLGHGISMVSCDNLNSGKIAAELLLENGCREILQTVGSNSINTPWNERHKTFGRIIEENHAVCHTHIRDSLKISDLSFNRAIIGEHLDKYPGIDGYFGNDISSAAALMEAVKRGRRVPEDFRIISCDGSLLTEMTSPQITTIKQPIDRIAAWAVDTIYKLIIDPKLESCEVQLSVELIKRGTTL
jgi:LacI family sucrose operon transcriptional repressor